MDNHSSIDCMRIMTSY